MGDLGEALRAKYGTPVRLADDADNVFVFKHSCEESARAFAAANGDNGRAECRDAVWVSVADLRAEMIRLDTKYRENDHLSVAITPPPGVSADGMAADIRAVLGSARG